MPRDTAHQNDTMTAVYSYVLGRGDPEEDDSSGVDYGKDKCNSQSNKTVRHVSTHASCWHVDSTENGFPWPTNNTKYMCLRWHGGGAAQDWLWFPPLTRWGRGPLRVKFRCHLVPRVQQSFTAQFGLSHAGVNSGMHVLLDLSAVAGAIDSVFDIAIPDSLRINDSCVDHRPLFYYQGDSTMIQDWSIDDFEVYAPSESSSMSDIGVQRILYPAAEWPYEETHLVYNSTITPTVLLRSFGPQESSCVAMETCMVYFRVFNSGGDDVWLDSTVATVPNCGWARVALPEWTVNCDAGERYRAVAWVRSAWDDNPANDTCWHSRLGFWVLDGGIWPQPEYPYGETRSSADMTTDGEVLYLKGGKGVPLVYRFTPAGPSGQAEWDTVPNTEMPAPKPKSGGIVFVPRIIQVPKTAPPSAVGAMELTPAIPICSEVWLTVSLFRPTRWMSKYQ
jgi:hypothetical protein